MRILLPTDGSNEALAALKYALTFTKDFVTPSSFDLLAVYDPVSPSFLMGEIGVDGLEELIETQSREDLSASLNALRQAGVDYKTHVIRGPIVKTILTHIQSTEPDLVIMGVKGRGMIGDLLVGSVARAVSAESSKPVLLVDPKKLPGRIVCQPR